MVIFENLCNLRKSLALFWAIWIQRFCCYNMRNSLVLQTECAVFVPKMLQARIKHSANLRIGQVIDHLCWLDQYTFDIFSITHFLSSMLSIIWFSRTVLHQIQDEGVCSDKVDNENNEWYSRSVVIGEMFSFD